MERYQILPHEDGIAIVVPHIHQGLISRFTPESSIIAYLVQSGWSPFRNDEEHWGLGDGLRVERDEQETRYIATFFTGTERHTSKSLHLLTAAALSPMKIRNPDPEEPLIHLTGLIAEGGSGSGYDMGAELSPHMVKLLARFTDEHRRRVESAMRATFNCLSSCSYDHPFICATHPGPLSLVVPGEETHLACEDGVSAWRSHSSMSGHNIDTPRQQFALLAGLAEVQAIAQEIETSS